LIAPLTGVALAPLVLVIDSATVLSAEMRALIASPVDAHCESL
jgi:hypothetical protein